MKIKASLMTDRELFDLCRTYGKNALEWRRKFIGLLPEVDRRRLWEKKGFGSIYEFAAKLAGVSKEQVKGVIRVEEAFEDKPVLKNLLVSGEVSVNKLARIVSIASEVEEEELAESVKKLPKSAVETMVRDFKVANLLPGQQVSSGSVELSQEVKQKLNELNNKGIDVNEVLLELLNKREEEIELEKEEIAVSIGTGGKYTPVKVKKIMEKEFGTKCAVPNCHKLAEQIHHTARFALTGKHDPRFMAPLCHEHHLLAHYVDMRVWEKREEALST